MMSDSKSSKRDDRTLLETLIEKEVSLKEVYAHYRYVSDLDKLDPNVDKEDVSNLALSTIELIEATTAQSNDWVDFKWKLAAFTNLVDVFDSRLYENTEPEDIFQLWYFYFEGKYSLTESILCGLNGYYAGSKALLRVFLEFNLLQLYYVNVTKGQQAHRPLRRYFEDRVSPG